MGEGNERKRGTGRREKGKMKREGRGEEKKRKQGQEFELGGMDVGSEMGKYEEEEGTKIIKKKVKRTWDRRKSENGNGKKGVRKEERAREQGKGREGKDKTTVGQ